MNAIDFYSELPEGGQWEQLISDSALGALEYLAVKQDCCICVTLTSDERVRALNAEHRGKDAVTDVLSFPLLEFDLPGRINAGEGDYEDGRLLLGDIVIALGRANLQAAEYGHSLRRELGFLTVHSVLHLLGYDHMTEDAEREMLSLQENILNDMGLER